MVVDDEFVIPLNIECVFTAWLGSVSRGKGASIGTMYVSYVSVCIRTGVSVSILLKMLSLKLRSNDE